MRRENRTSTYSSESGEEISLKSFSSPEATPARCGTAPSQLLSDSGVPIEDISGSSATGPRWSPISSTGSRISPGAHAGRGGHGRHLKSWSPSRPRFEDRRRGCLAGGHYWVRASDISLVRHARRARIRGDPGSHLGERSAQTLGRPHASGAVALRWSLSEAVAAA